MICFRLISFLHSSPPPPPGSDRCLADRVKLQFPEVTADRAELPFVVIERTRAWAFPDLRAVWDHRELLYFLAWRDVKVKYKQAALGVAWVVLQPFLTMAIFTLLFGVLLKVPSSGVPYAPFAYAALVPWTFFSAAVTRSTLSLASSSHLVTKVYFPRVIVPTAAVLSGLPDFLISLLLAVPLAAYFGLRPGLGLLLVIPMALLAPLAALALGLWLSALNARYRDVGIIVPFLLQVGMYATPVVYGSALLPERFRPWLFLNPIAPVVEGFRMALLGERYVPGQPLFALAAGATLVTLLQLLTGAVYIHRTERLLADFI